MAILLLLLLFLLLIGSSPAAKGDGHHLGLFCRKGDEAQGVPQQQGAGSWHPGPGQPHLPQEGPLTLDDSFIHSFVQDSPRAGPVVGTGCHALGPVVNDGD